MRFPYLIIFDGLDDPELLRLVPNGAWWQASGTPLDVSDGVDPADRLTTVPAAGYGRSASLALLLALDRLEEASRPAARLLETLAWFAAASQPPRGVAHGLPAGPAGPSPPGPPGHRRGRGQSCRGDRRGERPAATVVRHQVLHRLEGLYGPDHPIAAMVAGGGKVECILEPSMP